MKLVDFVWKCSFLVQVVGDFPMVVIVTETLGIPGEVVHLMKNEEL
jgi:hypothetical protein